LQREIARLQAAERNAAEERRRLLSSLVELATENAALVALRSELESADERLALAAVDAGLLADAQADGERLQGELARLQGELARLAQELSEARDRLSDQQTQLAGQRDQLALHHEELARLRRAEADRARLERAHAAVISSLSWRVTRPLRSALSAGRRLLRRHDPQLERIAP
jgi:chromosome segregation ATPase